MVRNIRIQFTKTAHTLHPLGNYPDNYICPVAKIQASSLCICTDSHLHRLYLFDISRPTLDRLKNQIAGYRKDDLAISSVNIRDEGDGDAVCADICCDLCGYYVYALLVSRENKGAWIKIFKHHNRTFTETGLRYAIPYDDSVLQAVMRNDVVEHVNEIPLKGHIGLPIIYQQLCYGAGMEYYNGYLYIITRRKVPVELVTVAGYDVVLSLDEQTRHSIRLYEKRVGEVQFNLLTILNASSGACYGHYYLSKPDVAPLLGSTSAPVYTDAVFQGLTWMDDKLITQVRYDHNTLASDVSLWHLQEAKVSMSPEVAVETFNTETGVMELPKVKSVIPVLQGKMPNPLPTTPLYLKDKVSRVIRRIKNIQATSQSNIPTPIISTRGQTALVSFTSPLYNPPSTPVYELNPRIAMSTLPYTVVHNRFPWGIAMAYSLSADSAERKLYGVYGNQLWVYDMMDYTLVVRYPNDDGTYTFFEGDIIDMGDVTLYNRSELQCFLKNNSDYDMIDVHLVIDLLATEDDRAKELFLSLTQGSWGYKDLALGTVPAGGSKEFWVEIHPQDIQEWEWHTSHRVPLQVIYTNLDDTY